MSRQTKRAYPRLCHEKRWKKESGHKWVKILFLFSSPVSQIVRDKFLATGKKGLHLMDLWFVYDILTTSCCLYGIPSCF